MSRIGKKPIYLASGVTTELKDSMLTVKGAKGELVLNIPEVVQVAEKITEEDKKSYLEVTVTGSEHSALWGTYRALIANMITGVTEGWTKILELNGVGFRMNLQGKTLVMNLGFSHEVKYELPGNVEGSVEGNTLTLTSIDKQSVGKVASEIRAFKKPEPYKGKGFKYHDEVIRRKAGKTAKAE
jgi:large subunit ribosomal protein L6